MNTGKVILQAPAPEATSVAERELERTGTIVDLILVDQRVVNRGCLGLWIGTLDRSFNVTSIADVETLLANGLLGRARAVIFSSSAPSPIEDSWLKGQIDRVRSQRPDVPIVLLAETDAAVSAHDLARRLHLAAYVPTSSSMDLTAAALRLIVAGGAYFPPLLRGVGVLEVPSPKIIAKLTPREHVVLELLECGLPNKTIGTRLGMSPGTVKSHVHNIITKLNVRNRTEAAVARYAPMANLNTAFPQRAGDFGQDEAAKVVALSGFSAKSR